MGVDGQTLGEEELVTGTNHSTVVQVYIIHEKPRADAVGLEGALLLKELHVVLVEEQSCLVLRVGCHVMCRAVPEMTELAVAHLVESAFSHACLYTCHQPHPKGNLRAVEGCLLDDALGAVCNVGDNHLVGLVGGVAEEIALENGLCTRQLTFYQMVICTNDGFQLLGEWQTLLCDTDYCMILLYLRAVVKARHVGTCILEIYPSMILIHRFLYFWLQRYEFTSKVPNLFG